MEAVGYDFVEGPVVEYDDTISALGESAKG